MKKKFIVRYTITIANKVIHRLSTIVSERAASQQEQLRLIQKEINLIASAECKIKDWEQA